ncbi:MAG: hypothetical protein EZS28_009836 [Streblomastix strix]|uniref:Uncharacterized protein n=1 Tax=Streblomastix strix TaxID=222440 RepID=A0A5J4WI17_9EUKA|nr:MAG: hypothetical protein EZS28_009836 [Streblomastix strix]
MILMIIQTQQVCLIQPVNINASTVFIGCTYEISQILEKQIGCVGPMNAEEQLSLLQRDANWEKQHEQSAISSQEDSRGALSDLQRKSLVLGQNDQQLKGYMGQNIDPVEQKFRKQCTERQKAIFANFYMKPMESLDRLEGALLRRLIR